MITTTVYLSSNPSSTIIFNDSVELIDITNVVFNLDDVSLLKPPLNIKFNWGDLSATEQYINDFFTDEINAVNEFLYGFNYTIMKDYNHIYSPSETSITRKLSAQALITYFDRTSCLFIQPFTIYSPSFNQRIGDMEILKSNFIDKSGNILYTFGTKNDGYVIDAVMYNNT